MLPDSVEWDDDFDAAESTLLLGARNEQRCLATIARHASAMLLAMQRSRGAILAHEHALFIAARRAVAGAGVAAAAVDAPAEAAAAVEATATATATATGAAFPPLPSGERARAAAPLSAEERRNLRNARLVLESELASCEFFAELAAVTAPLLALPAAERIERVKAKHAPRLESSAISRFVVATSGALASSGM